MLYDDTYYIYNYVNRKEQMKFKEFIKDATDYWFDDNCEFSLGAIGFVLTLASIVVTALAFDAMETTTIIKISWFIWVVVSIILTEIVFLCDDEDSKHTGIELFLEVAGIKFLYFFIVILTVTPVIIYSIVLTIAIIIGGYFVIYDLFTEYFVGFIKFLLKLIIVLFIYSIFVLLNMIKYKVIRKNKKLKKLKRKKHKKKSKKNRRKK